MWRGFMAVLVAVGCNIGGPVVLIAHGNSCDASALRIEGNLGDVRIVRGVSDLVVLTVGIVRPVDVARLVAASPNAVAQAKVFESNYRQGIWTGVVGVGVWAAVFAIDHIGPNVPVPVGVTFTTVALVTYGAMRVDTAKRALSKAVWWYNRDLKR